MEIERESKRTVKMAGNIVINTECTNRVNVLGRQHSTAARVVGILETDSSGSGVVLVVRSDSCLDIVQIDRSVWLIRHRRIRHPEQGRRSTPFILEDVLAMTKNDLVTTSAVGCQAHLSPIDVHRKVVRMPP
jgi:hypothetical protein